MRAELAKLEAERNALLGQLRDFAVSVVPVHMTEEVKGVLLQCHTARLIGNCNHWILHQTSLLH